MSTTRGGMYTYVDCTFVHQTLMVWALEYDELIVCLFLSLWRDHGRPRLIGRDKLKGSGRIKLSQLWFLDGEVDVFNASINLYVVIVCESSSLEGAWLMLDGQRESGKPQINKRESIKQNSNYSPFKHTGGPDCTSIVLVHCQMWSPHCTYRF